MDLSQIKPIEKHYNVQNPADGKPTGMILTLACSHDDRVMKAQRAANDMIIEKGKDATDKDAEDYDIARWSSHIVNVEFEGDANWRGEKPKYSEDLAKDICSVIALREQVAFEVRRTKDFYQA